MKINFFYWLGLIFLFSNCTQAQVATKNNSKKNDDIQKTSITKVIKTKKEWNALLTREEFRITRDKGTERAFTGKDWDNKSKGIYTCKCCDLPLFHSSTKFKSGTGWPSFYEPMFSFHVGEVSDNAFGWNRVEVICNRCDAHLGHVFDDGPEPTGLRYCINSASLKFEEKKD